MTFWRRTLAALTLLVSAAVLLISLAGAVGVWLVREPVTAKAIRIFTRVEAALDFADEGLDHVKQTLDRAAERLDGVREAQRKLAAEPGQVDPLRRILARTVQQQIAPDVSNAHEELHMVAEAAVVVNSVLEDVGNIPFFSVNGLDLGGLTEMNDRLAGVAPAAWEISRLLGEPAASSDAEGEQLSRVDRTLKSMRAFIAEYEPHLAEVREKTEALKATTLPWITPAATVLSLACSWIALSQLCLLFRAWSWWKQ
jgi:hypothetical protein